MGVNEGASPHFVHHVFIAGSYVCVLGQWAYPGHGLVLGSSCKKYTSGHVMAQSYNCTARSYDYVTRSYDCGSCTKIDDKYYCRWQ